MTLTDYSAARDTRQHRAIRAGTQDRAVIAAYRETLDRLRDAQARYELNRDDRASDAQVSRAIRDVLIARADLEHLRRRYPAVVDAVYMPESRCPKCGGYSGASWIGRSCQNAPRGVLCMGILEPMPEGAY